MLEAVNLTKRYKDVTALNGLDLAIGPGEVFCLLGANGAGKTTTIHLFLNFVAPTSGTARINGLDVTRQPLETKKYVGYIPETVMLYGDLTGLENLTYFCALAGRPRYRRERLLELLSRTGLNEDAATRRVNTYSKGMRQKVGIAIALAKEAKVLLLDEPTSGLDPKAAHEFTGLVAQLSGDGVAVLMATHDLFRAKDAASRLGIMKRGRLVATLDSRGINYAELERIYLAHMHE
jgi:ABC-2 type transport system ATP-binding protein